MNKEKKQLTIAFHVYNFSYRGTENALYDYADKNETILKNKSIIVCPSKIDSINNIDVIIKFSNRFKIFLYNSYNDLKAYLLREHSKFMSKMDELNKLTEIQLQLAYKWHQNIGKDVMCTYLQIYYLDNGKMMII